MCSKSKRTNSTANSTYNSNCGIFLLAIFLAFSNFVSKIILACFLNQKIFEANFFAKLLDKYSFTFRIDKLIDFGIKFLQMVGHFLELLDNFFPYFQMYGQYY